MMDLLVNSSLLSLRIWSDLRTIINPEKSRNLLIFLLLPKTLRKR